MAAEKAEGRALPRAAQTVAQRAAVMVAKKAEHLAEQKVVLSAATMDN